MIAANAALAENILVTDRPVFKSERTELLSPPSDEEPHVTTEPSDFKAANAYCEEYISMTSELKSELTELLSPPSDELPHVITEPSDFKAANA